jgi:hypothetical protein
MVAGEGLHLLWLARIQPPGSCSEQLLEPPGRSQTSPPRALLRLDCCALTQTLSIKACPAIALACDVLVHNKGNHMMGCSITVTFLCTTKATT